ncbi:MAG: sigma-70 family RNA polymerase sigma factor [Bacteroidia bacterium]
MNPPELLPHLFRTEFRKIAAVLCRHLGIDHIETAEDLASDTFLAALEVWTYQGIPPNPSAWLYTVAKNKARNHLNRAQTFSQKVEPGLKAGATGFLPEIDLSEPNIIDSQLQMLFAVCHPTLSAESQISLALRILCGFGIEEIANALLTSKDTINKRLYRAKEKLRQEAVVIGVPPGPEITRRLDTVLTTLYLLYNEGYYSESYDTVIREDFCLESMRLTHLLLENEKTNRPEVNALFSLMCFHSSRFPARKHAGGEPILYEDQDESLWNQELIGRGAFYLHEASRGDRLSRYHIEAAIAWWHTRKADTEEKWENILRLYDHLLPVAYSPVAALNRVYAFSRVRGKTAAIAEAEKLSLTDNHYYYTLLGELYKNIDPQKSQQNFRHAHSLARTEADRKTIKRKMGR